MTEKDSVVARVEAMGVDEIGRRYLAALQAPDDDPDEWIVDAVWFGQDLVENDMAMLPLSLRWELAIAALEACPDDDGDLWCLGDAPFDQLAAEPGSSNDFMSSERRGRSCDGSSKRCAANCPQRA